MNIFTYDLSQLLPSISFLLHKRSYRILHVSSGQYLLVDSYKKKNSWGDSLKDRYALIGVFNTVMHTDNDRLSFRGLYTTKCKWKANKTLNDLLISCYKAETTKGNVCEELIFLHRHDFSIEKI